MAKSEPVQITRMTLGEFNGIVRALDKEKRSRLRPSQLDVLRLTKYASDSVTVDADEPVPECVTCGVCCDLYAVVPMDFPESERLGEYIEVTADGEPNVVIDRLVKRDLTHGRCSHLQGELGREIGCSVYERRPSVCRAFEAGSDKCHEYRRMYGIDPQLTDEQVERFRALTADRKLGVITNSVCFVDSVSVSIEPSVASPGRFTTKQTVNMKIAVAVDGEVDDSFELHQYDPEQEKWLQSEFIGMTLDGARELIAARLEQGFSN